MITAAQLRAARGLLDWSRGDLSKASKISQETIKNIEHGIFRPQEATESALAAAFAIHGVEFIGSEGVAMRRDSVVRLEGPEGIKKFVDSVYSVAQQPYSQIDGDKPICGSNFNDDLFAHHVGEYLNFHVKRMNEISNLKVRILAPNDPIKESISKSRGSVYRECRKPSGQHSGNAPFYVYGDNLAILILDETIPQIIVISSPPVAKAYRQHFDVMWKVATPIEQE